MGTGTRDRGHRGQGMGTWGAQKHHWGAWGPRVPVSPSQCPLSPATPAPSERGDGMGPPPDRDDGDTRDEKEPKGPEKMETEVGDGAVPVPVPNTVPMCPHPCPPPHLCPLRPHPHPHPLCPLPAVVPTSPVPPWAVWGHSGVTPAPCPRCPRRLPSPRRRRPRAMAARPRARGRARRRRAPAASGSPRPKAPWPATSVVSTWCPHVPPPMSPRTRSLSPPCPLPAGAEVEKPPGGEKGDEKPPEEEPKERPGDPDPKRGTWGGGLIGWGPAGGVAKLIRGGG